VDSQGGEELFNYSGACLEVGLLSWDNRMTIHSDSPILLTNIDIQMRRKIAGGWISFCLGVDEAAFFDLFLKSKFKVIDR